jgi:DNA-binding protein H-NS
MQDAYKQLPFDELRTLHREIGALIATKRTEALEELRAKASILGFTAEDLAPKKRKSGTQRHYQDPDNPANTYGGKGKKPQWLVEALANGRQLEEFAVP